MDGWISWKWVSFIIHQKCVIQDVLKMTGRGNLSAQLPRSFVLRKKICLHSLITNRSSECRAAHKGAEDTNQTKQHECSTGAERHKTWGTWQVLAIWAKLPGHAADCAHQPRSALCSILAVSAYNMVTGVWPPTVVCWYHDPTCICRIQASFHSSKNLSYNNMLTRLIIRVCFSSEHEGSLNHTTYNPYLQKTALTRDVKTLDTGH